MWEFQKYLDEADYRDYMECDGDLEEKDRLQRKGIYDYHLLIEHRRKKQEKQKPRVGSPDYGRKNSRRNR